MRNLLDETLAVLARDHKSPSDVLWVGSRDGMYACSWDGFAVLADRVYDDGYGSAEVTGDLVVVGADWWLERGEYDGSEWWEFKTLPKLSPKHRKMTKPPFPQNYESSTQEWQEAPRED